MLNKFTAAKKIRREDDYSPGGEAGHRPDRATLVYSNRMKEAFRDVPLIIGGIEASLRRFGHYDYWSDTVRRSILVDSKADVLIYGMGELQIIELAEALDQNRFEESLPNIRGICYMSKDIPSIDCVECPSFEEIKADKMASPMLFAFNMMNKIHSMDDLCTKTWRSLCCTKCTGLTINTGTNGCGL